MRSLFVIFLLGGSLSLAQTEVRTGQIFENKKDKAPALFFQETTITPSDSGEKKWSSKVTDANGKMVISETATSKEGLVSHQHIEQFQTHEIYELERQGSKATFKTYQMKDGVQGELVSTKTVDVDDNFVTGPVTDEFFLKNWAALQQGQKVLAQFGVFELSRTVDFQFKKIAETDDIMQLQMKASNFFISMFVDPIIIDLDKKSKKILRFKGRTPMRSAGEGSSHPLDAEIFYK